MSKVIKVKKDKQEIEVTEKAYEVVYKDHGFQPVEEKKKKSEKK
jgi:hypothetical protein